MVLRYCLGMIMSVSILMIGMGAATPVNVVNLSMTISPIRRRTGPTVPGGTFMLSLLQTRPLAKQDGHSKLSTSLSSRGPKMTPHNHAKPGDYAEAVLLPGDPLRAKWIAETFLTDAKLVNSVRNCLGYTGSWNGKPVSVQATGMGQPSTAIYVHELLNAYGVQKLIRIGTCGGLNAKVKVRDLILAQGSSTDSTIVRDGFGSFGFAPLADFGLLRSAAD